jgi:hypothetical protein
MKAASIKLPEVQKVVAHPSLGTDPEMFVRAGTKLLPAFCFLPDKYSGIPFESYLLDGRVYWDGFQAEWKLNKGETCIALIVMAQQNAMKALLEMARKVEPKAKLSMETVVKIPAKEMKELKEEFVALGCDPSSNAYGEEQVHVTDPRKLLYRCVGGHVHIGPQDDNLQKINIPKVVKLFDAILGVWAVGAAESLDNPLRRKLYGRAGEYRTPKYGFEYRTLSNFWLCHPYISNMVFEIARKVYMLSFDDAASLWAADEQMVRDAINHCDVKMARKIMKLNEPMFRWLFRDKNMWQPAVVDAMVKVGQNGVESLVKEPENLTTNWVLDGKGWTIADYSQRNPLFTLAGGVK